MGRMQSGYCYCVGVAVGKGFKDVKLQWGGVKGMWGDLVEDSCVSEETKGSGGGGVREKIMLMQMSRKYDGTRRR